MRKISKITIEIIDDSETNNIGPATLIMDEDKLWKMKGILAPKDLKLVDYFTDTVKGWCK